MERRRRGEGAGPATLAPTAYLVALRDHLKATEPELWSFFARAGRDRALADEARQELLRLGYRIDGDAHRTLVDAAALAADRIGVDDPVTLYQAHDGGADGANAQVVSLPGEVHVLFSGRLLELLEGDELVAVLGHELAHHLLWSHAGDDHWVLDRLVHASASDVAASPAHVETARLVRLHTELFADRGGLVAVGGDVPTAVAALVKVSTGMRTVSGTAYLQQAAEVIAGGPRASAGVSHPELFVRAWALQRWAEAGDGVDEEVAVRLAGPVDLDHLDILRQRMTADDVCAVIARFLAYPWARTDPLLAHARLFGDTTTGTPPAAPVLVTEPGLADLFAYVLLDLATADPDVEEPAMAAAMVLSDDIGIAKRFDAIVVKELKLAAKDVRLRRAGAGAVLAGAS